MNPSVASVDANGVLKGKANGTTKVIAAYGAAADTATITIEIGAGAVLLDSMDAAGSWKVSGMNIDTAALKVTEVSDMKTMGQKSFRIDYAFTYTGSTQTFVFLEKEIPVFGVPDSFYVDLRSDSAAHRVSVLVTDDNGEQFRYYTNRYNLKVPEFDHLSINAKTPSALSTTSVFNYPIALKRIEVQLGSARQSNTRYSGTFFIDNFRMSYPPAQAATGVFDSGIMPASYTVGQNYPNPFNPSTTVKFTLSSTQFVSLKVFDILGKEVATLVQNIMHPGTYTVTWNARTSPSGIYFYQFRAGSYVETRRMMLLK
ncbi:MAG: T9SS type A sorting domain-containing protein [Acidobacteriota bacterium]